MSRSASSRTWPGAVAFADTSGPVPERRGGGRTTVDGDLDTATGTTTTAVGRTGVARVLVVDDEPPIRTLLRLVLRRDERFELVGEAVDAEDAIGRAADLQPDVILLDLLMPGQHGRDALPALRAAAPDAMILVLSSLSALDEEHAVLAAGAAGYLEKSVLGPRLPEVVADHLARFGGDER